MGREPPLGRHLRPRPQTSQRRRRPASDFGIRSVWSGGASISNENFASSRFQGVREITSREETERPPENRLGRSQHAPACPRNRKTAGDLARQIQPLPSRSRRHLDYESSDSPSPSRSYRRPETESLPVTELTGSNLSHARPGAGRALVRNGETGRAQSQRIQPRHGHRLPAGG